MDASREFGLFRTGFAPLRRVVATQEPVRNEAENTPLQKLVLLIQQKIENLSPSVKLNREHLKALQETHRTEQEGRSDSLYDKIEALFSLSDSLKKLQEKLHHRDSYVLFAGEPLVKRLKRPIFLESVRNLKSELDKAMKVAPIDAEELGDFKLRADLIKRVIQSYQNYALEFQKKRLFSEEHNVIALVQIDSLAAEIVEDIKQNMSDFPSDIPFFEFCLKCFLNDENVSLMSYKSCETGWLISKKEHKNLVFHEDVLKVQLSMLCSSLHRDYAQAGLELAKKIDKFSKDKQSLMQEIDVQLNILKGFQDHPAPEQCQSSTYQPS